jgi:hypothetical protein
VWRVEFVFEHQVELSDIGVRKVRRPSSLSSYARSEGTRTLLTVTAGTILRSPTVFPDRLSPEAEADRA